ncbi:uncharacterized protein LOC134814376 [Bolinopsis microptera]|uniref:uncharacterized protein LOC134814376 n=1 Tax=Bolinopsis microptera TaxID=2820187 RepID=UPI00307A5398
MPLGHYLTFIGGKAPLPDPAALPTSGDVLRYLSFCATSLLTGTPLLHQVAQTLLDTYCCSDSHKSLVGTPPAKKGRYNLMKLENLAPRLAAEQLSNGTAARFLSKYNEVVGIQEQVTEKKIRNIRAKSRGALLDNLKGTAVEALYFDGRKDRGTLLKDSDEVLRRQEEEHITLVEQPSGRYLGFATPDSGSVVVLLEKKLGRELQRSVCSLHRIELPFRHFFTSLDGVTTGPNSFSGPTGKLAAGPVHQMASRKFVPLRAHTFSPLPDGVVKKLSWDQKVLYRHVLAVQTGALPPKLAGTEIGPLCHARWITFQSRILRLFMSGGVPGNVMGGYVNAPPRIQEPSIKYLRTTRNLEEGMVITVEPGVYFGDALIEAAYANPDQAKYMNKEKIEPYRGTGGVRIEDGVAVTADGTELLSHNIPRTVEEIEEFMNRSN